MVRRGCDCAPVYLQCCLDYCLGAGDWESRDTPTAVTRLQLWAKFETFIQTKWPDGHAGSVAEAIGAQVACGHAHTAVLLCEWVYTVSAIKSFPLFLASSPRPDGARGRVLPVFPLFPLSLSHTQFGAGDKGQLGTGLLGTLNSHTPTQVKLVEVAVKDKHLRSGFAPPPPPPPAEPDAPPPPEPEFVVVRVGGGFEKILIPPPTPEVKKGAKARRKPQAREGYEVVTVTARKVVCGHAFTAALDQYGCVWTWYVRSLL